MAVFTSDQQIYDTIGALIRWLAVQEAIAKKFHDAKIHVLLVYENPNASIFIDARKFPAIVTFGPESQDAEVVMSMSADVAHDFWLQRMNLPLALIRRQIRPKGPMPKVLRLLPLLKPAYAEYPRILKEKGYERLVP